MGGTGGRPKVYNKDIHAAIVEGIQRGAFVHVAAEAAGITYETFRRWMKEAETKGEESMYYQLYLDANKAHNLARREAEARVYKERPLEWLRLGPGRPKDDKDGWTERTEVSAEGGVNLIFNIVKRPEEIEVKEVDVIDAPNVKQLPPNPDDSTDRSVA